MKKFKRVYIEITNICNKNCSFCSKSSKQKKYMSLDEFEHILKEIKPFTNYIYLHVKGEPLIHPNFNEILKLCSKYNINVNITTNGTLLQKRTQEIINNPCIRQLNISLHSFEQENSDQYLNSVLNSITDIQKKRDLIVVYRFWALQNLKLNKSNMSLLNKINEYYHLDKEIIQKIETEKNIRIKNNIYINKHELFEWPNLKSTDPETCGFCYGLSTQIAILVDGTTVPCCLDSEGIINLGNIFNDSFESIIYSSRAQKILKSFRQGKIVEELCQKCKYRRMLKRGIITVSRSDNCETSHNR